MLVLLVLLLCLVKSVFQVGCSPVPVIFDQEGQMVCTHWIKCSSCAFLLSLASKCWVWCFYGCLCFACKISS